MTFDTLQLSDDVLDALDDMQFTQPTPIQQQAIPHILAGRDLLGIAQTGTGKTAAFLLPILTRLSQPDHLHNHVDTLVIAPTRELVQQTDCALQGFSYYTPQTTSLPIYGGNDGIRYEQERRAMQQQADILIATPGRLITHLALGNLSLDKLHTLVLDEADRMLDMGFHDDIKQIIAHTPATRQTILFSATMPKAIRSLAEELLTDPVRITLAVNTPADAIRQTAVRTDETQKLPYLLKLFEQTPPVRTLIFASSKQKVKELHLALRHARYNADAMHSDLEQKEREEVMYRFKAGKTDVLVATDILSRGIDIDDIRLVVNYDVPFDPEDYVHRVGRTARAGADGNALTLVSKNDARRFADIERFVKKSLLPREKAPQNAEQKQQTTQQKPKNKSNNFTRKRRNRRSRPPRQDKQ